ncbi:SigB/SigF/SigG family RNA polymerase sigma factor [Streptomyces polyrhachis]|uniref:SigB/SigF/SigG family RNA polymerase sigma factor n=1 Tax=Streptomyces polyrhachis TaxID=1282885 RepID=A0ABW2GFE3_9ACTN
MLDVRTTSTGRKHSHHDTPDTEALFVRIAALPDGPERSALRRQAVCAWMPMATRLAGRYRNRGESFADLEQVARLGLVKAVARYDPTVGIAFPGYAVPTIVGEMKRHFRDHLWAVHVPRRAQELRRRVRTARHELDGSLDCRGPSVPELVAHTGLSEGEVRLGQGALECFATLSLDTALDRGTDDLPLAVTLGREDPGFERVVDRAALRPLLRALPERERRILYLRFFREMTQSQIAEELGVSQMHISRLITLICARLRDQVLAATAPAVTAPAAHRTGDAPSPR